MLTEPGSRRRLDADARRRQLIELGLEMLTLESGEQIAVDRIAEAAGISRGLLFHYFPTKRAYYVAVVEAAATRMLAVIAPDPRVPPEQRLRAGLAAYIRVVSDNQARYVSLVRGAAGRDDELREIFDRTRDQIVERLVQNVGLRQLSPSVRLALYGWLAFVEESTIDWLRHHDVPEPSLIQLQEHVLTAALTAAGLTL
jgi:AcrR family transcriptional regulator